MDVHESARELERSFLSGLAKDHSRVRVPPALQELGHKIQQVRLANLL